MRLSFAGERAAEVSPEADRGAEEDGSPGATGSVRSFQSSLPNLIAVKNSSTFEDQRVSGCASHPSPDYAVCQGL